MATFAFSAEPTLHPSLSPSPPSAPFHPLSSSSSSSSFASTSTSTTTFDSISIASRSLEELLHSQQFASHARDFFSFSFPTLLQKIFGFQQKENEEEEKEEKEKGKRHDQTLPSCSPSSAARSSDCWLSLTNSEQETKSLLSLLSPSGPLFSSFLKLEKLQRSPLLFAFPTERLPHWIQPYLTSNDNIIDISVNYGALHSHSHRYNFSKLPSFFRDRIKQQIDTNKSLSKEPSPYTFVLQIDVFEYFFFWFAYYALCEREEERNSSSKEERNRNGDGNSKEERYSNRKGNGNTNGTDQRKENKFSLGETFQKRKFLTNWSMTSFGYSTQSRQHSHHSEGALNTVDPYLHLLHLYLTHFVTVSTPLSSSSLSLQETSIISSRAHPWPPDLRQNSSENNYSTNYTNTSKTRARGDFVVNTLIAFWLSNEDADSTHASSSVHVFNSRLIRSLQIFVNHINRLNNTINSCNPDSSSTYSQQLQRPLYMFLQRAFSSSSWSVSLTHHIKKVSEVAELWLDYIQPWNLGGSSGKDSNSKCTVYTEDWRGFVTSNYLFYTNLTLLFLEFALKHMHVDPETMLQTTTKILNVLAGSTSLLSYLKGLQVMSRTSNSGIFSTSTGVASLVQDQLQNWESGSDNMQPLQLQFFYMDGNGGRKILKMLILRAEREIQMVQEEASYTKCSKYLDIIKETGYIIFGTIIGEPELATSVILTPETAHSSQAFVARSQHAWLDVKYKGDWMRRPIESTEVAWLVRCLVSLSDSMNGWLELGPTSNNKENWGHIFGADNIIPLDNVGKEAIPLDNVGNGIASESSSMSPLSSVDSTKPAHLVLSSIKSVVLFLHCHIQRRGWRVNLRFLAKKPIAFLLFLLVTYCLTRYVG